MTTVLTFVAFVIVGWVAGAITERLFSKKGYYAVWLVFGLFVMALSVVSGRWLGAAVMAALAAYWAWLWRTELDSEAKGT